MPPVLVLVLVVVAGLAATRLPPVTIRRFDLRLVQAAGVPLLLLGVLLGPISGGVEESARRALAPVMALGIGWIGAMFGVRIQWRLLRRIPRALWIRSAVQAGAVYVAVGAVTVGLALAVPALRAAFRPLTVAGLALAGIAVVSGPRMTPSQTLQTAFGAMAFTLALALDHAWSPANGAIRAGGWLVMALGSGAVVGVLFLGLAPLCDPHDFSLLLLGTVVLGAGVGYATGMSPFLVCALAAGLIAHRFPQRRAVAAQLTAWEPPIYAAMLVLSGAWIGLQTWWILPAAVILAATRVGTRWALARFAHRDEGLAGATQDGIALALALNFALIYWSPAPGLAETVLTTVILGVVLSRLATPFFIQRASPPPQLTASPAPAELS